MKSKKEDFIIISYLKRVFYHFVKHQRNGFFNVENPFFAEVLMFGGGLKKNQDL